MLIDWRRFAVLLGMGAAALVAGIAAHGIVENWRQQDAIAAHKQEILHSPTSHVAGNPDGDVSVIAFFDYNCPYCRQDAPPLAALVAEDRKVRLVLKELPVLGADSEGAARVALAAGRQGKYFDLYQRLFAEPGRATEAKALRLAAELGLDQDRLKADMQDPAIAATLAENARLAAALKLRGVPFYIVGDQPLGDAADDFYANLKEMVAEARASGQWAGASR